MMDFVQEHSNCIGFDLFVIPKYFNFATFSKDLQSLN
jgi:hypothetical protein